MLEKMIENQILIEKCLNRMQEPSEVVDLAIDANIDQWGNLVNLIYEKYPGLVGVINIQDFIDYLLYAIEEKSLESGDQVVEYAELVSDVVARFIRGVDKIRGGSVNEG